MTECAKKTGCVCNQCGQLDSRRPESSAGKLVRPPAGQGHQCDQRRGVSSYGKTVSVKYNGPVWLGAVSELTVIKLARNEDKEKKLKKIIKKNEEKIEKAKDAMKKGSGCKAPTILHEEAFGAKLWVRKENNWWSDSSEDLTGVEILQFFLSLGSRF